MAPDDRRDHQVLVARYAANLALQAAIRDAEEHAANVNEQEKQAAKAKRFTPPPVQWAGFDDKAGEALRTILGKTINDNPEREIADLEYELRQHERNIEHYKDRIREYREAIDEVKRRRQGADEKLAALRERLANPQPIIGNDELASLERYIRDLPGVLGVKTTADGSVKVLVRTAIRDEDKKLFDMGDYELSLPANGFRDEYVWERCVRLPKTNLKGAPYPRERNYNDLRLHHHHGYLQQREDGTYYIDGGRFCFGDRGYMIADHFARGDIKQALNLLIASLNDTQYMDQLETMGRYVPAAFEEQFFAVPTNPEGK